jgi:gamma-glutamyltranspeptidase/glutathione hydrolase
MVAASHRLASEAGVAVLAKGGSAVDAAIAANAVLCVAYPHMCGLGGDGFWLIYDPKTRRVDGIEAAGPAAAKATIEYYRARGCAHTIPARGPLAALTVPGAVEGWRLAHERHGRLDWADLFGAAIRLARDGVDCAASLAAWIAGGSAELALRPALARIFLPGGTPPEDGDRIVQKLLARSLERIARDGPRAFYEGDMAETICAALGPRGSPLAPDDFARFRAEWVAPIATGYRGHALYEMPPPTQGLAALSIANLLDGFDVAQLGAKSAAYFHHVAEAVKLAYADRDAWLTDPRFLDIPVSELIDRRYADARRALIDPKRARGDDEIAAGIPGPTRARQDAAGGTCYFCAIDRDGLAASVIQSLYYDFGSAEMGGDTGIVLQNRGSFFSLDPGHPNRLEPGKRTFHTLIPALLTKDGRPALLFGSMGGEAQPQTQAMVLTRIVDFGMDAQAAVAAPRFLLGATWGEARRTLMLESRAGRGVAAGLERLGHPVMVAGPWEEAVGHAQAIRIRDDGSFEGGADPRGDGAAVGL